MKRALIAASAAALVLGGAFPAFADDHHGNNRGGHSFVDRHDHRQYHEGDNYHGHRLVYHGGHWGYFRPGSQSFISINL